MARKAQKVSPEEQAVPAGPTLVAEQGTPASTEPRARFRRLAEIGSVLEQGRTRIDKLDAALEKLAASALTVTEIGRRVEALRSDGRKRLAELRADALKRVDEAPGTVISAAAGAARQGLRSISNELHAMAQRLDGRKDTTPPPAA
ncbi:MAG TPA: hypothetical protein VFP65_10785 [Anaeromyxobacteraceae bacterium]|nr:hypothetical protein [Anaeromyxobacteraceae bacterium]